MMGYPLLVGQTSFVSWCFSETQVGTLLLWVLLIWGGQQHVLYLRSWHLDPVPSSVHLI